MAQLELKTTAVNADLFRLFNQSGEEIALPDGKLVLPKMTGFEPTNYLPYLDKEIVVDLRPGRYWLVKSSTNVTRAYSLDAGDAGIRHEQVGCVANDFPTQAKEAGKVALAAPHPVLDAFIELGGLKA